MKKKKIVFCNECGQEFYSIKDFNKHNVVVCEGKSIYEYLVEAEGIYHRYFLGDSPTFKSDVIAIASLLLSKDQFRVKTKMVKL